MPVGINANISGLATRRTSDDRTEWYSDVLKDLGMLGMLGAGLDKKVDGLHELKTVAKATGAQPVGQTQGGQPAGYLVMFGYDTFET